ncbi:hypothetical protein V0U79_07900 [Hyphobacterium sp. HN65]|uniref:Uncharacterized protein n=1 Tax=Hyphobacterium lacteum TaxID=3116575 RepID=A0ABU7LQU8_9PROT|nr:hypothetical protein [Hyphobacterium sp. HN65]MEE2526287.1 hypothetical protein [Hyphobacterium sp. HN65]
MSKRFYKPENRLGAVMSQPGGMPARAALARAKYQMTQKRGEFEKRLKARVKEIQAMPVCDTAGETFRTASMKASDIVTLAGVTGQKLTMTTAAALIEFAEWMLEAEAGDTAPIPVFIDSIRLAHEKGPRMTEEEAQTLVARLHRLTDIYQARYPLPDEDAA